MSFIRTIMFAGVMTSAAALSAHAAVISASIVPNPTAANVPFTLENLGSGGAAGLVAGAASPLVLSTGVVATFTGNSGVYVGDVGGVTRSPLRNAGGSASNEWYFNARANSGYVEFALPNAVNTYNLLWGSVDANSPANYNLLTITLIGGGGTETITGGDIIAAAGGAPPVVPGTSNIAVTFTTAVAFDTIRFTATQEAFEFLPGVPVPEPASLALLGMGLLGLGYARSRRRRG